MVVDDHAARVAAQAVLLHVVQNLILVDDVRVEQLVELLEHVLLLRQLADVDALEAFDGGGDALGEGDARARGAGDEHVGLAARVAADLPIRMMPVTPFSRSSAGVSPVEEAEVEESLESVGGLGGSQLLAVWLARGMRSHPSTALPLDQTKNRARGLAAEHHGAQASVSRSVLRRRRVRRQPSAGVQGGVRRDPPPPVRAVPAGKVDRRGGIVFENTATIGQINPPQPPAHGPPVTPTRPIAPHRSGHRGSVHNLETLRNQLERARWNSWNSLGNLSTIDAMRDGSVSGIEDENPDGTTW